MQLIDERKSSISTLEAEIHGLFGEGAFFYDTCIQITRTLLVQPSHSLILPPPPSFFFSSRMFGKREGRICEWMVSRLGPES